jgi:hypothetical protein
MRSVIHRCLLLLGAVLMTSCAAIFTGTKGEITFSAYPETGTTVRVGEQTYSIDGQPVKLKKKVKKVVFSNPSYGEYEVPIHRKFQGGMLFLDILFTPGYGLLGILIDGPTAAWYKLPTTVHLDFASEMVMQSTDKDPEGTKVAKAAPKETGEAVPASSKGGQP